MIMPKRRGFLLGALSLLAAPTIVRATSLMPVKVVPASAAEARLYRFVWMDRSGLSLLVLGRDGRERPVWEMVERTQEDRILQKSFQYVDRISVRSDVGYIDFTQDEEQVPPCLPALT